MKLHLQGLLIFFCLSSNLIAVGQNSDNKEATKDTAKPKYKCRAMCLAKNQSGKIERKDYKESYGNDRHSAWESLIQECRNFAKTPEHSEQDGYSLLLKQDVSWMSLVPHAIASSADVCFKEN